MGVSGSSLAERLQAFHRAMLRRMAPGDAAVLKQIEGELAAAGPPADALRPGDLAPDFLLPDQHDVPVRLSERLALGPVVLVFYRGGWCPFCTLTLRAWQDALPALHDAGGDLLALSPQQVRDCCDSAERDLLAYPVLSDRACAMASRYGITHEHPEALRPLYLRLGHDLPRINATSSWRVPLPATFVVAQDGRIALAHVGLQSWDRLEPSAAIEAVRALAEEMVA